MIDKGFYLIIITPTGTHWALQINPLNGAFKIMIDNKQAAEYLGLSPKTLANHRSSGKVLIPFVKIGNAIRYRKSDLDKYLKQRTYNHTGEVKRGEL
jgi:excisionase family DNA binding protein